MGAFTPVQRFLLARGHGRKARRRERWVTRSFSPEKMLWPNQPAGPFDFHETEAIGDQAIENTSSVPPSSRSRGDPDGTACAFVALLLSRFAN